MRNLYKRIFSDFLFVVIWKMTDKEHETGENYDEDESLASFDNTTMSIYCGAEERLRVPIDMMSDYGETEFHSLGNFYIHEEVTIVLSSDTIEAHNILDKISVPIICLDKNKPSDLTIEHFDRVFTITFKFLPPPPAEFRDSEYFPLPSTNRNLSPQKSVRSLVDERNSPAKPPTASTEARANKLSVRLSDIYSLIRSMVIALSTSVNTASIAVETIQLLTSYIFDSSRIGLQIVIDIGWESMKAVDATIFESLSLIDESLELYRKVAIDCLHSVFARLKLDAAQLEKTGKLMLANFAGSWIRFPVRMTRPLLNFALNTALPVYKLSQPLIDPSIDRLAMLRNRIVEYPLVGSVVIEAENVVNFARNEISEELQKRG